MGLAAVIISFVSCGIEDYLYLDPVPQSNVNTTANTQVTISRLSYSNSYLQYYGIYYRIYLSNANYTSQIDSSAMSSIHSTLYSDYQYLERYTEEYQIQNNTSGSSTANIGSVFNGRNYNLIALENGNLENVLSGSNASGYTVTLDFIETSASTIPVMRLSYTDSLGVIHVQTYNLFRNSSIPGAANFDPEPDRYFRNTADLRNSTYASKNTDVVQQTGSSYAYASFYIVAIGVDDNIAPIYSSPTFLGVMRLPGS
ncbi:hypothetical protein [Breznakiella homolactica]|uniref:Uncharacterized protein n=1 Tax=Breznakiella homolactica TaxID=2798577 RepID=A0A7T8B974_9SPIR|nr:hypothetical protein [Breznakiella homolactica]QQO08162.1 hypothetical protein JFL75_14630 [Breznakiella homolactica]